MTIRITTTRAVVALVLALAYVGLTPATPAAADREHQQIMADLRILQEQTLQLQALMTDLGEALKAVNSRIEDQTSLERKAFADGKVQMDTISGDIRVVREKVDETNVRLGTITQELESLRQAIPEPGAVPQAPVPMPMPARFLAQTPGVLRRPDGGDDAPARQSGHSAAAAVRQLLGRLHGGNYVSRRAGIRKLPAIFSQEASARTRRSSTSANRLRGKRKTWTRSSAYDRVIANYPGSPSVPTAYYKRGMAFERLGEPARARESYEAFIKQFPDTQQAVLAKQRLEPANRPTR